MQAERNSITGQTPDPDGWFTRVTEGLKGPDSVGLWTHPNPRFDAIRMRPRRSDRKLVFSIRIKKTNGKWTWTRGEIFSGWNEAKERRDEIRGTKERAPVVRNTETLREFGLRMANSDLTRQPSTLRNWKRYLQQESMERLVRRRVSEITWQNIYDDYVQPEMERKIASGTIYDHLNMISSLMKYAIKLEIRTDNPKIEPDFLPPRGNKKETPIYGAEQIKLFLADLGENEPRFETIGAMGLMMGPRVGEVLGLSWDDWDRREGMIEFVNQRDEAERTLRPGLKTTKRGSRLVTRKAPVPVRLVPYLERQFERTGIVKDRLMFPDISATAVWRCMDRIAERLGPPFLGTDVIEQLNMRTLRHQACTRAAREFKEGRGEDITEVAAAFGHKPQTFLKMYVHDSGDREGVRSIWDAGLSFLDERSR